MALPVPVPVSTVGALSVMLPVVLRAKIEPAVTDWPKVTAAPVVLKEVSGVLPPITALVLTFPAAPPFRVRPNAPLTVWAMAMLSPLPPAVVIEEFPVSVTGLLKVTMSKPAVPSVAKAPFRLVAPV